MRDGEPNMYTALATMRNGYMQMQWSRVQMFLVFNTVALPIVFGSAQNDTVKVSICVVAVSIHILLMLAMKRAEMWIKYIDVRLSALEKLDWDTDAAIRVRVFSHRDFDERRASPFASRKFFGLLGVAVGVLWTWEFVQYTIVLVK